MIVTILGCGTSSGVPLILCQCGVCTSKNKKNKRLRASIWIRTDKKSFLVDTSTDLRQQALLAKIPRIDAVLYTHPHADHSNGIDEIRSFNYMQKEDIPMYGNSWSYHDLIHRFPYIFKPHVPEGGGVPRLVPNLIDVTQESIEIQGETFIPLPVKHGSQDCLGYRVGQFAYVTDCSHIPQVTLDRMQNLDVLVLDCLRYAPHKTHYNFDQAMETIRILQPKKTYLTHMGHELDYTQTEKKLPKNIRLAYDGLTFEVA